MSATIYAQRVDGRRELFAARADGSSKRFVFAATDEAWLITETTYPAFGEGRFSVRHRRYRRGLPVGMRECTVCRGHGQVTAGSTYPFACPNCMGRGQVPAARQHTVTDVPTGVLWICTDCMIAEANGEDQSEEYPPLGELGGMRITLGMSWEEHADGCDNRAAGRGVSDCNCEVIPFHPWGCPTCGNPDHGERHAATGWRRVTDVWTDAAQRVEQELRDSHTV
jgi:rubrerythrin